MRSKLDRMRSPLRRCSPERDTRGLRAYKRFSPSLPSKRRKLRTHEHVDSTNDFSEGFKNQDGSADSRHDKMHNSSNSRKRLEDELKQVQYEVDVLLNQKSQMEIELEGRVQEADSISSRIRDLEVQLSEEKNRSKRVNSKIKKLIRAHVHHSRLQDEIKRSQVQLEQLVGELGTDDLLIGKCEDKLKVSITNDEEVQEFSASPVNNQLCSSMEASQGSKSANKARGHEARVAGSWRNSLVRFDGQEETEMGNKRKVMARTSKDRKSRLRNNAFKNIDPVDKVKSVESNLVAPPTSMAAHAVDDFIELMEPEENFGMLGTPKNAENSVPFLLPPLPSVSQNNYTQYEGDDENVDVDGLEELEEVDIV